MNKRKYDNDINFEDPRLLNAIENLDIFSLLDDCNVDYSQEGKNIGESFIGIEHCPSCSKGNFHFGIHREQFFGSCLVCKIYYSPLKLVSILKNIPLKKAFDYLIEESEIDMDVEDRIQQIFKTRNKREENNYRGIDHLPENTPITKQLIKSNKVLKKFLTERRLRYWDVLKYDLRIGVGEHKDKIIFPVYVAGKLCSYQWRKLTYKKYHIPQNLSKYLLFEDDIVSTKTLILVEGYLDAIHLKSFTDMFYPNRYSISTGFTKSLSSYQETIIIEKNPKSVICFLDSKVWFEYKRRFKDRFSFDVDFVILPTIDGKESDPNSLNFNQLRKVFKRQIL